MKIYYSAIGSHMDILKQRGIPNIAILLSYYDIKNKELKLPSYCSDFFLDSGAFSAWNSGVEISIDSYIDYIKKNKGNIDVCASLDVIGDPVASYANQKYMKNNGINCIPVYHTLFEKEMWFEKYLEDGYTYIGLGGMAGGSISKKNIIPVLDNLFQKYICDSTGKAKIKVHGFGILSVDMIMRYPWESIDATSWHIVARCGALCTPWGRLPISETSQHTYKKWITIESLKKVKKWVEDLGRDFDLCCRGIPEASYERMIVNILFFESIRKIHTGIFTKKNLQKRLFI